MAAAIVREGGRVLLVQNRWPIGTVWSLPGGRIEPGEAAPDAAVREVREETGLVVEPTGLAYVQETFNQEMGSQFLYLVFACRPVGGCLRQPAGDDHAVAAAWVPEAEVPRYMTWVPYRDPLLDYLAGRHRPYYLNRDAGLKPGNVEEVP